MVTDPAVLPEKSSGERGIWIVLGLCGPAHQLFDDNLLVYCVISCESTGGKKPFLLGQKDPGPATAMDVFIPTPTHQPNEAKKQADSPPK